MKTDWNFRGFIFGTKKGMQLKIPTIKTANMLFWHVKIWVNDFIWWCRWIYVLCIIFFLYGTLFLKLWYFRYKNVILVFGYTCITIYLRILIQSAVLMDTIINNPSLFIFCIVLACKLTLRVTYYLLFIKIWSLISWVCFIFKVQNVFTARYSNKQFLDNIVYTDNANKVAWLKGINMKGRNVGVFKIFFEL